MRADDLRPRSALPRGHLRLSITKREQPEAEMSTRVVVKQPTPRNANKIAVGYLRLLLDADCQSARNIETVQNGRCHFYIIFTIGWHPLYLLLSGTLRLGASGNSRCPAAFARHRQGVGIETRSQGKADRFGVPAVQGAANARSRHTTIWNASQAPRTKRNRKPRFRTLRRIIAGTAIPQHPLR